MDAIHSDDIGQQPPVSWKLSGALADLERDGELEFVRDLIETFLRDTAARLENLRKAAAAEDLDALAACSHTLKGSMLLMSANRPAELCCEIQMQAAEKKHRDYLAMVDRLEILLQETRKAMISHADALARSAVG